MSDQTAVRIPIVQRILSANDQVAAQNRARLQAAGVTTINIMASPGAGKTSLLLATIAALRGRRRIGVIEGDVASQVDADKIAATGAPVPLPSEALAAMGVCVVEQPARVSAAELAELGRRCRLPLQPLPGRRAHRTRQHHRCRRYRCPHRRHRCRRYRRSCRTGRPAVRS